MSKLSLALKLSDELGVTVAKAQKYIDDVGMDLARKSVDNATSTADNLVSSNWWKVAAGGTAIGGTAYAFKQAEVEQAKAIAEQNAASGDAIADIMDSDMSPKAKKALVESLLNSTDTGNGGDGGGGLLPGDAQTTIILLIVLVVALRYTLGGDD